MNFVNIIHINVTMLFSSRKAMTTTGIGKKAAI